MSSRPKFEPHPQNAPGDFYVVKGECLACGIPHVVAPDLIGGTDDKVPHCFWKTQPTTPAELDRAIAVLDAQELGCYRYAGTDPVILQRIVSNYCDYPLPTPNVMQPNHPAAPTFALLDAPSLMTKLWRKITRQKSTSTP